MEELLELFEETRDEFPNSNNGLLFMFTCFRNDLKLHEALDNSKYNARLHPNRLAAALAFAQNYYEKNNHKK